MDKARIISYFDKISKTGVIGTSATKIAEVIGVHRHTISNWLDESGYYEDDKRMVFCIDTQDFIKQGKRNNGSEMKDDKSVIKKSKESIIVPQIPYVVQSSLDIPIQKTKTQLWNEMRAETK